MKRSNKLFRTILSLALVLIVCLGVALPAFAANNQTANGVIEGTSSAPAKATIAKVLQMPAGVTTPTATFEFLFTPKSYNGVTDDADKLPDVNKISDVKKNVVTIEISDADNNSPEGGIKTASDESAELTRMITFPNAGVYTYTVTEKEGTYVGNDPDYDEIMAYSDAKYDITFWVENDGSGGLYVSAIAAKIIAEDSDDQENVNSKVDPTPGSSEMVFTNTYQKVKSGGDPRNEVKESLSISNEVTGAYSSKELRFEYNVTVSKAAIPDAKATYKAYILSGSVIVTSADNFAEDAGVEIKTDEFGKYFEFTPDSAMTIYLKHDERIVFTDLAVDGSYTAIQTAMPQYDTSLKVIVNGVDPTAVIINEGDPISTGTRLIGEKENSAAFTNAIETISPTGLFIDNLPYILLLVMALGSFAIFVADKSRRRTSY